MSSSSCVRTDTAGPGEIPEPAALPVRTSRRITTTQGPLTCGTLVQVLGAELAGKIAADSPIPAGCPFKPGDRVFGASQGAYAERVAANWKNLQHLPENMSFDQGAGKVWAVLVFRGGWVLGHGLTRNGAVLVF